MTARQRSIQLETLKSILTLNGFKVDSYGNYKVFSKGETYRFKFKKVNLRYEVKGNISGHWINLKSLCISKINVENFRSFIERKFGV